MEPQSNNNKNLIIKIVAGILVLGLAGFAFSKMDNGSVTDQPLSNENNDQGAVPALPAGGRTYKNGTYAATGTYISPAGQEEVGITLTIENDVVTAATFDGKATNPGSVKNQGLFEEGFTAYVVGKSIDEIELEVVNGSSLTPKGFMDALTKIKADALVS